MILFRKYCRNLGTSYKFLKVHMEYIFEYGIQHIIKL
jgi:hypothetical protein